MNYKDEQIKLLTEQNDELENYFRNTIIPQLFVDANLILRKYTPPAMKQFDLSPNDIGKSIHDLIPHLRFSTIIENISDVIKTSEILEKEIQTSDFRWYQMNILPYIRRTDKKANGVIITFVDITTRIKDLKEQEKLIADHGALLDSIAHDIKNPLTNLALSVEILKRLDLNNPKDFEPLLQIIENGVNSLQSVIQDLIVAREGEHKYGFENELLNIENIIEDVRLTLLENLKEAEATIESDIHVSEIFFVRRKLRSIIYNLVNNALKFKSPDRKPVIYIATREEDHYLLLTVKDNGIGIDANKQKTIFSKNYRINNDLEGSGMGLYLVEKFVTDADGKILVESKPKKGTTFKIYLKKN